MDPRAVFAAYDEQIRRRPAPDLPGGKVERDRGVVRCISGPDAWNGVTWSALEDADRLRAIVAAIGSALTAHQREVFCALALNGVPIDVLAERLATTRGALYKTLHDARRKLRAGLADAGYALDDHGHTRGAK